MILILMRHGEALPPHIDPDKSLSAQGRAFVKAVGNRLKGRFNVKRIAHSGITRARQTAEIINEIMGLNLELEELPFLTPESDTEEALREIEMESGSIILVSHRPFLPILLEKLVGHNPAERIIFTPGTAVCLTKSGASWMVLEVIQ